jgi:hypothetical protein
VRYLLGLDERFPYCQGPLLVNTGQNATERTVGRHQGCLGNPLLHGGLLTMRGRGIPTYAWVRGVLFAMPSEFQNHPPPWPGYPHPSSGNPGLFPRRSIPRAACCHLPGTCVWNAVGLLCSLSLLVPELGIWWLLNKKCTLGALSFRRLVA